MKLQDAHPAGNGHTLPARYPPRKSTNTATAQSPTALMGDDLVVKPEVAATLLGVSPHTLQKWASVGEGPAAVYVHRRRACYRIAELKRWLRSHERGAAT